MKKLLLILFLFAHPAFADLLNTAFENGTLSDWTKIGDALAVHAATFGTTTSSGQFQALMTTAPGNSCCPGDPHDFLPLSGVSAARAAASDPRLHSQPGNVEAFFGAGLGTLMALTTVLHGPIYGTFHNWVYEFSGIKQSFTANAGDVLSFEWNFLSNETVGFGMGLTDFAVAVLDGAFVPLRLPVNTAPPYNSPTVFAFESQNHWHQLTIPTTGTHTLGFAVIEAFDGLMNSGLAVDSITLVPAPEPSTLALLTIGLLGAGIVRSARSRKGSIGGSDS